MTTHTRAARARRDRTEVITVLAGRLDRIAIGHLDRLTPAEAALLAETIRALQADVHHLAQDRRGIARARSADIGKLQAAETAIREAEEDRVQIEAALARARDRCQAVRDRVGPSGMINASQVLGLLSPTWPDGNHEASPVHIGNRTNAEDCPACEGTNPPYPFICPGPATKED